MEKRIGNVIIQTPGGTASKNSSTYKVSLPSAWIKEMGITDSDRQIKLIFDGTAITISKKLSLDEFISSGRSERHKIYLLSYYDDQTLCSKIAADFNAKLHIIEGGAHGFGKKHDAISVAYLRRFAGRSHPWQSNGDPVRTVPR